MFVSPAQYLELTDDAKQIQKRCQNLQKTNQELNLKCCKLQQQVQYLQEKKTDLENQLKESQNELIKHITNESTSVKNCIDVLAKEQQQFITQQILKFSQEASVRKIKELQKKMTQNRIKNHEMVDFYEKVKRLYQSWKKTKKQPKAHELYQWINQKKVENDSQNTDFVKNIFQNVIDIQRPAPNKNVNGSKTSINQKNVPLPSKMHNGRPNQSNKNINIPPNRLPRHGKKNTNVIMKNANSESDRRKKNQNQDGTNIDNSSQCFKVEQMYQMNKQNILDELSEPSNHPVIHQQSRVNVPVD